MYNTTHCVATSFSFVGPATFTVIDLTGDMLLTKMYFSWQMGYSVYINGQKIEGYLLRNHLADISSNCYFHFYFPVNSFKIEVNNNFTSNRSGRLSLTYLT